MRSKNSLSIPFALCQRYGLALLLLVGCNKKSSTKNDLAAAKYNEQTAAYNEELKSKIIEDVPTSLCDFHSRIDPPQALPDKYPTHIQKICTETIEICQQYQKAIATAWGEVSNKNKKLLQKDKDKVETLQAYLQKFSKKIEEGTKKTSEALENKLAELHSAMCILINEE